MKLLSRCAGSTRAPESITPRRLRDASAALRAASAGPHATVVGQKAVTPNFGRQLRDSVGGLGSVERVDPLESVDVHVDEPGTMMWPRSELDERDDADDPPISTILSPSMTSVPPDLDTTRQNEIGARQDDHERNISGMPVLGIDVGGTKTVCLLADEDERIVAEGREEGANLQGAGELALEKVLHSVMEKTLDGTERASRRPSASASPASIARRTKPSCAASWPHRLQGPHPRRQRCVDCAAGRRRQPSGHRHRLGNGIDRVRTERAGRSVARRRLGLRARRRRQRLLDWPTRTARRGSPRGRTRARDEPDAAPPRALRCASVPAELIHQVYHEEVSPRSIAAAAKYVQHARDEGDMVATGILNRAADELMAAATAVMTRLELTDTPFTFVLSGGMFQAVPWLGDQMQLLLPALARQSTVMRLDRATGTWRGAARAGTSCTAARRCRCIGPTSHEPSRLPLGGGSRPCRRGCRCRAARSASPRRCSACRPDAPRSPSTSRSSRLHEAGDADFSQAHTFNIDEFVGLPSTRHDGATARSCRSTSSPASTCRKPTSTFSTAARANHEAECERFEREIAVAWRDGFAACSASAATRTSASTSPARALHARSHRTRLALETRRANASLFGGRLDRVPREALTMGVGTILEARAIVLDCHRPVKGAGRRGRCSAGASRRLSRRRCCNCIRTWK